MRVYGRDKNRKWIVVQTDENGRNDMVRLTWLIQVLKLWTNESPFYADWGIPARNSIQQQLFPDYSVSIVQSRFSQYFASLIVAREDLPTPTYRINVTTSYGVKLPPINVDIPG